MQTDDPKPHAKQGAECPLFRKDMSKVCHRCAWWVGLYWSDPKSGETLSKWNCAMPMLAVANVDVTRAMGGVQAAVESMREETVKAARGTEATLGNLSLAMQGASRGLAAAVSQASLALATKDADQRLVDVMALPDDERRDN